MILIKPKTNENKIAYFVRICWYKDHERSSYILCKKYVGSDY